MSQRADRILELSGIISNGWERIKEQSVEGALAEEHGMNSNAATIIHTTLQEMNRAWNERNVLMNEIRETIKIA
jgi:hypothetical protein